MRIRKLAESEARQLFPTQPRLLLDAPRDCPSPTGCHLPLDLSALHYRPTPPFCAWCGAPLQAERTA